MRWRRTTWWVPALTAGLLLVLPLVFPVHPVVDAADLQRREAIAAVVATAPYFFGDWTGTDFELAPEAQRLLHPNATLSRRYVHWEAKRPDVSVVVVHCADVRDMRGHYPSICYESTGWSYVEAERGSRGRATSLEVRGRRLPCTVYEFRRVEGAGGERAIRVVNLFILPDGTVTSDIGEINRITDRPRLSARGAAQVQVVTDLLVEEATAAAAAGEVLEGLSFVLETLGLPLEPDHGQG
jgi:hypothetical protein